MGAITTEKTYTGTQLADIFYRPTLSGKSAEELGMRVLYNMPDSYTLVARGRRHQVLPARISRWRQRYSRKQDNRHDQMQVGAGV